MLLTLPARPGALARSAGARPDRVGCGPPRTASEGRLHAGTCGQQDVAAFTVAALDHPAARNNTIVIGGPEPLSWRDIVSTFESNRATRAWRLSGSRFVVSRTEVGRQLG